MFLFKVHVFFCGVTDVFCVTVPDPNAKAESEEMRLPGALHSHCETVVMENENRLGFPSDHRAILDKLQAQAQRNMVYGSTEQQERLILNTVVILKL